MRLQEELGLSMAFISHDLAAVRFACSRVLVLYLGRVMELADRDALFGTPQHPYTHALLRAAPKGQPRLNRQRRTLIGDMPSALSPPVGLRLSYTLSARRGALHAGAAAPAFGGRQSGGLSSRGRTTVPGLSNGEAARMPHIVRRQIRFLRWPVSPRASRRAIARENWASVAGRRLPRG